MRKSADNRQFKSLDELKQEKVYSGNMLDNPRDKDYELTNKEFLEAIVKNQEHLYANQELIFENQKFLAGYSAKVYGALMRASLIVGIGFLSLIPTCNRVSDLYDASKPVQTEQSIDSSFQEKPADSAYMLPAMPR